MSDELTVICGRYELHTLIGEGGMASVWRAKDLTLARPVAVKLLYAQDQRDRQALVDRFLREARIAASVQHRNVVHIVDFGTTDDDQPFMVMELLEGQNLGDKLSSTPPLTTTEFLQLASMTLRGLEAVHNASIIHRDLKPENIFLIEEGKQLFPKILDFGISRSAQPASGRRSALTTKEGVIVGTPEYMSPEQARGMRTIDSRTDIYSMGVILYEGLTGQTPFSSENVGDLIIDIVTGSPPPVCELNPNIPIALSDLVSKAIAKKPDDRYQTAAEMQKALLSVADELQQFRRNLSDFPSAMVSQPVLKGADADGDVSTLEFGLDEPDSGPIEVLPHRDPDDTNGPTTARVEPYPVVARRRKMRTIMVAGAVIMGAGLGALLSDDSELNVVEVGPQTAPVATIKPVAEQAEAAQPPPAAEAPTIAPVMIRLTGVPEDATVTVDGMVSTQNPVEVVRDEAEHAIKVVRSDGAEWQTLHTADEDGEYVVELPAAKPAPKKPRAKAAIKRKKKKRTSPKALRNLDF